MALKFRRLVALTCLISIVAMPVALAAQTMKGTLSVKGSLARADFSLVAQTKSGAIRSAAVAANGKFTLSGASSSDRLSLLYRSNFYSPIVLGVRKSKSLKDFKAAVKSRFCRNGSPRVVLSTNKKSGGAFNIEVDTSLGIAYLKKVTNEQRKQLLKGATAEAAASCLPQGLAGMSAQDQFGADLRALASDPDGDGSTNEEDLDDDDDGLSDAFDPDNDDDGVIDDADTDNNDKRGNSQLFYFQQLHLDRERSFHPKLQTVSDEMIDDALRTTGGLMIEVKDGGTVELNCGADESSGGQGLPWCTAGGSGRALEPYPSGKKFPEEADADSDGKGELSKGPTGDFQMKPGATSAEIQPGDTFIEEVTDSSGNTTKYVGVLNSVVHSVPGVVSIATGVATYTFDYPASTTSIGTWGNPVLVPATGDANVTITVYPPLYNTARGLIVPGVLTFITNIPNGPCTVYPGTSDCAGGGSGPGMLPAALYSNPAAGWELVTEGIRSNTTDRAVAGAEPVTYTINLTGPGGVSGWETGEYLRVPIQAMDENGTTSAHNVVFRRQP